MKAIILKELRQLRWWAALMLLGQTAWVIVLMQFESDPAYRIKALGEVTFATAFAGMWAGLALGLLQTVWEIRRDQWAFLMHRGLSATQIFLGKSIAGLALYGMILLIPLSIAIGICWSDGVERHPFSWYQTVPGLLLSLAGVCFYFCTILAVVWKAPGFVTRVIPFCAAFLFWFLAAISITDLSGFLSPSLALMVAVGVSAFGIAAWGAFVKSGESAGRPLFGTICLGISLFVVFGTIFLSMFAGTISTYAWLTDYQNLSFVANSGFMIGRDGHILKLVVDPVNHPGPGPRTIQGYTDLDDPGSKRGAELVGKRVEAATEMEPLLQTIPVWQWNLGIFKQLPKPARLDRVLDYMGDTRLWLTPGTDAEVLAQASPDEIRQGYKDAHWIYSAVDGWFYVYREDNTPRWTHRNRALRLIGVLGPDAFTDASQRPQQRFTKLLAASFLSRQGADTAWRDLRRDMIDTRRLYLLFEDGLYQADLDSRSIRAIVTAPEGHSIRSLSRRNNEIAVVYDDFISVHDAVTIPPKDKTRKETSVEIPGKLRYSIPIPKEIAGFEFFTFGRVPGRDEVVFAAHDKYRTWAQWRFIRTQMDGTILKRHDFEQRDGGLLPPVHAAIPLMSPTPLLLACAADVATSYVRGMSPGFLASFVKVYPGNSALLLLEMLGMSALCCCFATRTARRYGFNQRLRRQWQSWSFLLGPAGLLTLWLLRDWPALESCAECGKRRPVDRELCPNCRAPFPNPDHKGIEIFAEEPQPLLQVQTS